MAIVVSVEYNGGFLPDTILLALSYYHWGNPITKMLVIAAYDSF